MAAQVYQFESFRLDISERRLWRNGSVIPVRGKVFDTLCVLVRRSGRLLRKNELMEAIWPDTVVEENNLEHNLSVLRKILGQDKTEKKFIETVPRQGYRFVARVDALDEQVASEYDAPSVQHSLTLETGYEEDETGLAASVHTKGAESESEGVVYWGLA
jgi:DNA-binding winged helix-turn-helix (wHTH) protein